MTWNNNFKEKKPPFRAASAKTHLYCLQYHLMSSTSWLGLEVITNWNLEHFKSVALTLRKHSLETEGRRAKSQRMSNGPLVSTSVRSARSGRIHLGCRLSCLNFRIKRHFWQAFHIVKSDVSRDGQQTKCGGKTINSTNGPGKSFRKVKKRNGRMTARLNMMINRFLERNELRTPNDLPSEEGLCADYFSRTKPRSADYNELRNRGSNFCNCVVTFQGRPV